MYDRIIFHIDVNSAYLSWEAIHRLKTGENNLDLRTIPSAVVGDIEKRHGVVLAKSLPAKAYGVKTGESVYEARKKCPNLELVPPRHELYRKYSKAFMKILKEYSPCVEQSSVDEAYCDMTGTAGLFGEPVQAAAMIKDSILNELGFTVNIGVSTNKLLAKMASDFKKPNLVHTLFPEEIKSKMWPLPVSELFHVGRVTAKKLSPMGIQTIGDLAAADSGRLSAVLKKQGALIHDYANGIDPSEVIGTAVDNKIYGNGITTSCDIMDADAARQVLLSLCDSLGARLRKDEIKAGVISLHLVYFDFSTRSHQMSLPEPSNITNELYEYSVKLLEEMWDCTPIRNFRVQTGKLVKSSEFFQLSLFTGDKEKLEKLDGAIDHIRQKYGENSLVRGVFLDHLADSGDKGVR